jgi:ribonuclease BN (tRNA processing enzyme)
MKVAIPILLTAVGFLSFVYKFEIPGTQNPSTRTQIVLLDTGTPNADPERFGPSIAIVVNDTPYIVDFGPGVVRRAAAAQRKGVAGLATPKLTRAFVTHLHSDHTTGYADLIFTP